MYMISLFIITMNFLLIFLSKMILLINQHKMLNREKNSPFECGFDPFSNSRLAFSIHFFSISLMFLIFDIEITLILPLPIIKSMMLTNYLYLFSLFMLILLIIGLLLEWKEGSMEWK